LVLEIVVTNTRHRTDGRLPRRLRAMASIVWPPALLLLFLAAFRGADAGNRVGGRSAERVGNGSIASAPGHASIRRVGSAAETVEQCEQPPQLDVVTLEQCLLLQPDDVELMLDLGAAYESLGRWADAEGVYLRAARVDPRDGEAHRRLGRGYLAHGDLEAARREGEAARATQPGNPEVLHLLEADDDRAKP
jgi:tetratricopeptide (TPR) repeat protein